VLHKCSRSFCAFHYNIQETEDASCTDDRTSWKFGTLFWVRIH
jgi:hypothetical protein